MFIANFTFIKFLLNSFLFIKFYNFNQLFLKLNWIPWAYVYNSQDTEKTERKKNKLVQRGKNVLFHFCAVDVAAVVCNKTTAKWGRGILFSILFKFGIIEVIFILNYTIFLSFLDEIEIWNMDTKVCVTVSVGVGVGVGIDILSQTI